jgi:two-component system chemotaxis sensor kinase CheA
MANEEYLKIFKQEALNKIYEMNDCLIELEKNSIDTDVLNRVFRIMHTLKGEASLDNLVKISEIAHRMENIFGALRDNEIAPSRQVIDLAFEVVDILTELIKNSGTPHYDKTDISAVLIRIDEYAAKIVKDNNKKKAGVSPQRFISSLEMSDAIALVKQGSKAYRITLKFNQNDKLKHVMAYIIHSNLIKHADFIKSFPAVEIFKDEEQDFDDVEFLFVSNLPFSDIKTIIGANCHFFKVTKLSVKKMMDIYVAPKNIMALPFSKRYPYEAGEILNRELASGRKVFFITLNFDKSDIMKNVNAFIIVNNLKSCVYYLYSIPDLSAFQRQDTYFDEVEIMLSCDCDQVHLEKVINANSNSYEIKQSDFDLINKTFGIKPEKPRESQYNLPLIEVDKVIVDGVIENIGELILNFNVALQMMDDALEYSEGNIEELKHKFLEAYEQVQSTTLYTNALMDYAVLLRLVPVGKLFKKFSRIVRDISRETSKEARLVTEGERTRIEQEILEAIEAPIMHMVRNAIDHGIEPSDIREKTGKPREGKIMLKAYQIHNRVYIEIRDDGRGLDIDAIINKALSMNIISKEEIKEFPETQIFELIFYPGFSTIENVTSLSGRGVGMDVVKSVITNIGGEIKIASIKGEGTVFTLILPLLV